MKFMPKEFEGYNNKGRTKVTTKWFHNEKKVEKRMQGRYGSRVTRVTRLGWVVDLAMGWYSGRTRRSSHGRL